MPPMITALLSALRLVKINFRVYEECGPSEPHGFVGARQSKLLTGTRAGNCRSKYLPYVSFRIRHDIGQVVLDGTEREYGSVRQLSVVYRREFQIRISDSNDGLAFELIVDRLHRWTKTADLVNLA